jgi:UDP-glucose 4-epimerase
VRAIGSHMVKMLILSGYDVVVLDNLSTGCRQLSKYGEFVEGELADRETLDDFFEQTSRI